MFDRVTLENTRQTYASILETIRDEAGLELDTLLQVIMDLSELLPPGGLHCRRLNKLRIALADPITHDLPGIIDSLGHTFLADALPMVGQLNQMRFTILAGHFYGVLYTVSVSIQLSIADIAPTYRDLILHRMTLERNIIKIKNGVTHEKKEQV